jgi:hypothetical protein
MPRAKEIFARAIFGTRATGSSISPISFPFVYFSNLSYVRQSRRILVSLRRVTEPFVVVDDCSIL